MQLSKIDRIVAQCYEYSQLNREKLNKVGFKCLSLVEMLANT